MEWRKQVQFEKAEGHLGTNMMMHRRTSILFIGESEIGGPD